MVKHRVGSVLITEDSKLLGILTERDLFKSILKKSNLTKTRAIDIAVKKVAVIKPSATLAQAFQKMRELNFKRLPVISNNQVIGLLTIKDVLKVDPSLYSETGELHEIREAENKLTRANIAWPLEGFCENCGTFTELLKVEGKLLCPDCREELY
jgi:signal-transduction protein with cAMP-binding, CBS, and nucleotidyltransferase domain